MRILFALAVAATPLFAQEEGGAPANPELMYWKWANFVILAGLLAWLVVKQGGPALRARTGEIGEGLAAGEKAKAEADARAAEVQAKLANLEKEIAAMQASAHEELNREADRIRSDSQKEIARLQLQLEQETESAAKMAKLEVQRYAAKLAIDLAEQKVRARMSPDVQSALLESFLKDFPRAGAINTVDAAAARESHPRES
jgi:F-type H+-transporting ATPase subunit b